MALPWALALIAFFGWVVSEAYKQGKKEGTKEGEAQAASPPQSEWNTYAGEIQTFVEHAGLAFYGCELTLKGQPRELLLARSYKRAFRALSDTFPDGIFEGKSIVYTVSMSKRFFEFMHIGRDQFARRLDWRPGSSHRRSRKGWFFPCIAAPQSLRSRLCACKLTGRPEIQ